MDKLTVTARARTDKGWKDLDNTAKIPLDILDPAEMAAADDEVIDMTPVS
jgi:Holliday junction resolvase RusA-like endonuclease